MTEEVTLPASLDEATDRLVGIHTLVTAREWERAAVVAAFTHDHGRGIDRCEKCSEVSISVSAFARLGVKGLGSRNSVTRYRRVWQYAVEAGKAKPVSPGQSIVLPDMNWAQAWSGLSPVKAEVKDLHGGSTLTPLSDGGWRLDTPTHTTQEVTKGQSLYQHKALPTSFVVYDPSHPEQGSKFVSQSGAVKKAGAKKHLQYLNTNYDLVEGPGHNYSGVVSESTVSRGKQKIWKSEEQEPMVVPSQPGPATAGDAKVPPAAVYHAKSEVLAHLIALVDYTRGDELTLFAEDCEADDEYRAEARHAVQAAEARLEELREIVDLEPEPEPEPEPSSVTPLHGGAKASVPQQWSPSPTPDGVA